MAENVEANMPVPHSNSLHMCIEHMLGEARNERVTGFTEADVRTFAESLWSWSASVEDKGVRLWAIDTPGSDIINRHVLEIVGPDRPFLVDSLIGACTELGHEILALFHPIIQTTEGHRSLVQIHLSELSDVEQSALIAEIEATLHDVALATHDYAAMRERMFAAIEELQNADHILPRYRDEAIEFLNWLSREHFVFLGTREYTFNTGPDGMVLPEEPEMVEGSNLGLLRDEDRNVLNRGAEPLLLTEKISAFLAEPETLILAKATLKSRVHRRVACDYVGVKRYDARGKIIGEIRFLGLYTAEAYNESVRNIPLLRKRAERVIQQLGALPGTHNEKALSNIMEMWPRDELLQTKSEQLAPLMEGVMHLVGRPRTRLFVRPDRFNRFVSLIVFIPRDAYNTAIRRKITALFESRWNGTVSHFQPSFDGPAMVRVLYQIELKNGAPEPDLDALEAEIADIARTWSERFHKTLDKTDICAEEHAMMLMFREAFNAAYREAFSPEEALTDVTEIAALNGHAPVKLRAFRVEGDDTGLIRAKIYSREGAIALSDCIPIFERMGLFVAFETGYPVRPSGKPVDDAPETYWIHAFTMRHSQAAAITSSDVYTAFEDTFVAVWSQLAESDGFNALVFSAGLSWREASICRALCAYRKQSGLDPAQTTQIEAFNRYPAISQALIRLFTAKFAPVFDGDRNQAEADAQTTILESLKDVSALDHDRIFRRSLDLIQAIQRTNYYQTDAHDRPRPFLSFKIASQQIADLPEPKPFREIFVTSPLIDGVHCRFGPVARGGLRWSDRRDDFRTEVLGLVKAQQVKNAVIVPVGSKGGFFPKQLPLDGSREDIREAGIKAYRVFITALLDLTDNLIDGTVSAPDRTRIHDGDDPYLVVAADKGTATFSDIANEISLEQGFWLGDAFASGGSAGYDHKKMGITARGAWEAIKRHFRELGKDIQSQAFTVIGCGDMSGDVFGNGMLLSHKIQLLAAFNHLHIFIDPSPADPERLWQERKRLFDLPRSSWMDYNHRLISEGGGVFERSAKAISLTPQIKALTGLAADTVTPDELIQALLASPCELLWFGGIGTYVKASHENHEAAGDRLNDVLRIDASALQAKVIGEGANLGLTQAGRIQAEQFGVRLNSDAIDNSAGVDSSDHEVNIKILCTEAMRRKHLPRGERNTLLASMTEDVARHVLAHNYAQTGALSRAALSASDDHDALERLMVWLEGRGVLDRAVEGLPDTAQMAARKNEGMPLTRPEIAIIMAWTKIVLFDDLVTSSIPDDPAFLTTLKAYFPTALHTYGEAMQAHRLKREIIATALANRMIDVNGPVSLLRLHEHTGASMPDIVAGFEAAYTLLEGQALDAQICALDTQIPASVQMQLQQFLVASLFNLTADIVEQKLSGSVVEIIDRLHSTVSAIETCVPEYLCPTEHQRFDAFQAMRDKSSATESLQTRIATSRFKAKALQIFKIDRSDAITPAATFIAYQRVGEKLGLIQLRNQAKSSLSQMPYWDKLATRKLIRDIESQHLLATQAALRANSVDEWYDKVCSQQQVLTETLAVLVNNTPNFAQLALAADAVRDFMKTI